jgi:hypothetical protein
MESALKQLRHVNHMVNPADVARLSPLTYWHINFQGRYSFVLAESVERGELRPLRNPNDFSEDGEW